MGDIKTTPANIKGTRTERNIMVAYMSESTAYTSYIYFAKQATKENYYPIAQMFTEIAENELHHGKVYFKQLLGGPVGVAMSIDPGTESTTEKCLETAVRDERDESATYKGFAAIAREEGFDDIAEIFDAIAAVESHHQARFQQYLDQVKGGTVWKRDKPITWRCMVCGYEYTGTEPPQPCPACAHPYQHYQALDMLQ